MKPITVTFVLTGANAGKTIQFRQDDEVRFVGGRARYTGPVDTLQFVANRVSFYGAFMMGSPELEEALKNGLVTQEQINGLGNPHPAADQSRLPQLQGHVRPVGSGADASAAAGRDIASQRADGSVQPVRPEGDGSLGTKDERLIAAIRRLDPSNDDLWSADGRPLVSAVASIFGQGVTRAQIEAAMPGYTRELAAL